MHETRCLASEYPYLISKLNIQYECIKVGYIGRDVCRKISLPEIKQGRFISMQY